MERRSAYAKQSKRNNRALLTRRLSGNRMIKAFCFGFVLFSVLAFACSSFADAHNDSQKYYTSVYINSGDTLWDIANTYCSVEYRNQQEYIDEVMRLNHLTSYDIHSGNYLILPYYGSKPL